MYQSIINFERGFCSTINIYIYMINIVIYNSIDFIQIYLQLFVFVKYNCELNLTIQLDDYILW
jgi:hypothetical protein